VILGAVNMRYVSYFRVSTEDQGKSGLGLDAQRKSVERFVADNSGDIIASFHDIQSGRFDDRPELLKAMAFAKKHKAFVVVSKLDRLSRDVHFISGLMKHNVKFVVAELGHDVEPFMLHMYAVLAEKERKMIGQRTRDALAALKASGKVLGKVENLVKGQAKSIATRASVANIKAQNVLPIIRDIQERGHTTLEAIADELNRRAVPTPRGGQWYKCSVARVLKRAA